MLEIGISSCIYYRYYSFESPKWYLKINLYTYSEVIGLFKTSLAPIYKHLSRESLSVKEVSATILQLCYDPPSFL
jgi:hypothetical protein